METRSQQDEERANMLEVQVQQARLIAEEADRKYEEVKKSLMPVKVIWCWSQFLFRLSFVYLSVFLANPTVTDDI